MIHRSKVLLVALLSVAACGVFGVATASAEEEFHTSSAHIILQGETIELQEFKTSAGTMVCSKVSMTGTLEFKTVTQATLAPTFTNCEMFGAEARITSTGCDFLYTNEKTANGKHYVTHIGCTNAGEAIHLEVLVLGTWKKCVTIAPQTPAGGVSYKMVNKHIELNTTLESVEYTIEAAICGKVGTVGKDGSYKGRVTLLAKNTAGGEEEIWFE